MVTLCDAQPVTSGEYNDVKNQCRNKTMLPKTVIVFSHKFTQDSGLSY